MENRNNSALISPLGYIGYTLLWLIPVIGWLLWGFSCFSTMDNKRNYARSLVLMLFVPVFWIGLFFVCLFMGMILFA